MTLIFFLMDRAAVCLLFVLTLWMGIAISEQLKTSTCTLRRCNPKQKFIMSSGDYAAISRQSFPLISNVDCVYSCLQRNVQTRTALLDILNRKCICLYRTLDDMVPGDYITLCAIALHRKEQEPQYNCAALDLREHNHHCYYFSGVNDTLKWQNAREQCQQIGMDLVSVNNVETEYAWIKEVSEQLYGTSTMARKIWTGGNDRGESGTFRWIATHSLLDERYLPLNEHRRQHCVSLRYLDGVWSWRIRGCSEQLPYICETS